MDEPEKIEGDKTADTNPKGQEKPKEKTSKSKELPGSDAVSVGEKQSGVTTGKSVSVDPAKAAVPKKPAVLRLEKSLGIGLRSNAYRVILGKGGIPPVSEIWPFIARLREKDSVSFKIMEGDNVEADKNKLIGEIGLHRIQLREDGRAVLRVEFKVGKDKILEVSILDQESGMEGVAKFSVPQFGENGESVGIGDGVPVEELSKKLEVLEEQMQLLKDELTVRRERVKEE